MTSVNGISVARPVQAAVIRSGIQRVFVNRLKRAKSNARQVVVISPWITATTRGLCPFTMLIDIIRSTAVPAYFITREPKIAAHLKATEALRQCPTVELLYNENVHAKIYAVTGPQPHGFALLGSANLTAGSLELYEIALLIRGVGVGSSVVDELANFGLQHLRTRPESRVVKTIDHRSVRHGV